MPLLLFLWPPWMSEASRFLCLVGPDPSAARQALLKVGTYGLITFLSLITSSLLSLIPPLSETWGSSRPLTCFMSAHIALALPSVSAHHRPAWHHGVALSIFTFTGQSEYLHLWCQQQSMSPCPANEFTAVMPFSAIQRPVHHLPVFHRGPCRRGLRPQVPCAMWWPLASSFPLEPQAALHAGNSCRLCQLSQ